MKVTEILGNSQKLDGGSMFGNAPRSLWERWLPADEQGRVELACRALLVEANGLKILLETGIGSFFPPKLAKRFGVGDPSQHRLLQNLQAIGIMPEDIDWVVLSHLHFDHAGGALSVFDPSNPDHFELVFPRAQFLVSDLAWQRALAPHKRDKASFIPQLNQLLLDSKRLHVHSVGAVSPFLPDHFFFEYSHGHTPGQMHTLVCGEQNKIFFCGDLIPGSAWLHIPITMGYDRFPEQLIDEKEEIYRKGIGQDWYFYFTHDPQIAMVKIAIEESDRVKIIESVEKLEKFSL